MLQKFVFVTGLLDILIGLATWIAPLTDPQKGTFVAFMTLGAFLMFAGAALMWASKDLATRAPVVFWQGLVRLTAVVSILYAVPAGLSFVWEYAVAAFDGVISLVYIFGTAKHLGVSPMKLLAGQTR